MHASASLALFLFRVGFGLFLLVWGIDKIVDPSHTEAIFRRFYYVPELAPSLSVALGVAEIALAAAIAVGLAKTLSYGIGVLVHGASTISTLPQLIFPWAEGSSLLFMASVPVLLGAVGLFLARDADKILCLDRYLKERHLRRPIGRHEGSP